LNIQPSPGYGRYSRVAAESGEEGKEMEDMNDILNPPETTEETATDEEIREEPETVEAPEMGEENEATGETPTQVAAETTSADDAAKVKAELVALAKERERIRQKEAALDEERERLAAGNQQTREETRETQTKSPQAELKELRKQHRAALTETLLDPDDTEAAAKVEELEDRMEEVRLSLLTGAQRDATEQERMVNDFNAVYAKAHEEFPFLAVDHPQVNAELNDDINSYYEGRMLKGDSPAVALRKAVDRFAPAYAAGLPSGNADATEQAHAEKTRKAEADRMLRDKLSRGGFSEVRSAGRGQASKPFTGPTPMTNILGKS
jgi:hypothetical protein